MTPTAPDPSSDLTESTVSHPSEYTQSAEGDIPNTTTPDTTTPDTTTAGDELPAGDLDPGATKSADETGQGGDPAEPAKNKAHPWNG